MSAQKRAQKRFRRENRKNKGKNRAAEIQRRNAELRAARQHFNLGDPYYDLMAYQMVKRGRCA